MILELSINHQASYVYILKEFYIKRMNITFHNYLYLFLRHVSFKNSRTFCSPENYHRELNLWSHDLKDTNVCRSDTITLFSPYFWQIHFPHRITTKWLHSSLINSSRNKKEKIHFLHGVDDLVLVRPSVPVVLAQLTPHAYSGNSHKSTFKGRTPLLPFLHPYVFFFVEQKAHY